MDDTHSFYDLRQDAEESIYCDEDDIQILEEDLMQHELCPIPPDEIISEVQSSDNLKRRNRTNLSKALKKKVA